MIACLYVLPNVLSTDNVNTISPQAIEVMKQLRHFAVENVKTTRRAIRRFGLQTNFDECTFYDIHHKNDPIERQATIEEAIQTLKNGHSVGIMSEAGMAGMADPGSDLVAKAHAESILVKPLIGPSSVLLTLVASGFNGQSFTFHGYLPIDDRQRKQQLKQMERDMMQTGTTQLFMETPYRNKQLFDAMTEHLESTTHLCIACQITAPTEFIQTKSMAEWKKNRPDIQKRPTMFAIGKIN